MIKKKNLMLLSDSSCTTTGYATVSRNVLNRLKPNYNCFQLAHNYVGQDLMPPIKFKDNSKIDFTLIGQGRARYCLDIINSEIKKKDISIFGILLDLFMLKENHGFGDFLSVDTSPAKTFFYFPSDGGGGLPIGCETILEKVDMPIAMSKFGKNQVEKMYGIKCEYIPHGVDKKVFYKENKNEAKAKFRLEKRFVVGIMSRNQNRKMLDRSIKAFALFCKDKPNAFLLIHADPLDAAQSFDLNNLIIKCGIQNRVGYTGTTFFKPFTYNQMRDVYNCFDVLLHSSSGEGWSLALPESMACGVPIVGTDYTTSKQLIYEDGQAGELVRLVDEPEDEFTPDPHCNEILSGTTTGGWNVERGFMSIYDCVEKLNKLYDDENLRKKYSKNGTNKVNKFYTWEKTLITWRKKLKELEDR